LKTSDFSSLRCVRPGPNPNVVTRIARRDEFIEGQLSETQLRTLGQPLFHCEHLQRFNPLPTGQRYFAIAQQDESGRWEMTQECLNSSIFNHQRIRGERIECKTEEARDAMEALLNARYDLDVYPQGVQWAEGTRLIIRQPGFYHGRSDGILATQKDLSGMEDWRATWGEQRWLARFNSFGDPSSREPRQTRKAIDDIDIGEVQRVLSDHHEAAIGDERRLCRLEKLASAFEFTG
jgi:hypothetical protein